MGHAIGVLAMEHIAVGLVEGHRLVGPVVVHPERDEAAAGALLSVPAERIAERIAALIEQVGAGHDIDAVGVGFPGIIRDGVVEDSPNLPQMKGFRLGQALAGVLAGRVPVLVMNDADATAAGIAATRGLLGTLTRVWTLGSGVGFGRHPRQKGVGEGGHIVVSLDPKESLCGCGGVGHLEGIVGHRSMRLRFLDREPEEVFAGANDGEAQCVAFVRLWHRALAAAAASSIHVDGPGRLFLSGPNARFVDTAALGAALHEMVKMSPLQGSAFEVVDTSDTIAIVGATVGARGTMTNDE
jgi:glucokinase